MPADEGTIIAERFKLVRHLGQGGMGAVWLAQNLSLDIPCVVKFLHPEAAASTDLRARFEREAKVAAQLRSPHVVQIFEHGVWDNLPYIAMELLEGEDLDHRLKRSGSLGPRETVIILSQVARALTRAHAAGLVHRDLKPANIFLVRDDDRDLVKVLDFGIAKRTQLQVGDSKTKTGSILGTPFYMSPEQARGMQEVDHRSDLWALGVITYQCLLGRLPFQSDALGDLFMLIMVEPIPVPSRIARVPATFDAWWARAVARLPDERFQSAKEMADALAMSLGISTAPTDAEDAPITGRSEQPSAPPTDTVVLTAGIPPISVPAPTVPAAPMVFGAAVPETQIAIASEATTPKGKAARGGAGAVVAGLFGLAVIAGGGLLVMRGRSGADTAATQPDAPPQPASTASDPSVAAAPSGAAPLEPVDALPTAITSASAAPPLASTSSLRAPLSGVVVAPSSHVARLPVAGKAPAPPAGPPTSVKTAVPAPITVPTLGRD